MKPSSGWEKNPQKNPLATLLPFQSYGISHLYILIAGLLRLPLCLHLHLQKETRGTLLDAVQHRNQRHCSGFVPSAPPTIRGALPGILVSSFIEHSTKRFSMPKNINKHSSKNSCGLAAL